MNVSNIVIENQYLARNVVGFCQQTFLYVCSYYYETYELYNIVTTTVTSNFVIPMVLVSSKISQFELNEDRL